MRWLNPSITRCLGILMLGAGFTLAAPSLASSAPVIENNFTGTGSLKVTLEQEGIKDVVNCTGSTLKGTVSSPPDAKAKLSSWTWTGCTASSGSESLGSATVTALFSLPSVEALSTNSVKFSPLTVRAEYKVNGSTCKPEVIMGSWNYSYTNGSSTNQLSAKVPHVFTIPPFAPSECLDNGIGYFEPSLSFTNPQFEITEPAPPPPPGTFNLRNTNDAGPGDYYFQFGLSTDTPVSGDFNSDGKDTIGVYRPSTLMFYLRNTNSAGAADISFSYGLKAGIPVFGDWDGDGDETVGLYDQGTGYWYLNQANDGSGAELEFPFGAYKGADVPIPGDWDGDGDTTIGIYRPSTKMFLLRNSNTPGEAELSFPYGIKVGVPVAADWNGAGGETIGLWNPETGWWNPNEQNDGSGSDAEFIFGAKGDKPLTGDWNGDKVGTVGFFRP